MIEAETLVSVPWNGHIQEADYKYVRWTHLALEIPVQVHLAFAVID